MAAAGVTQKEIQTVYGRVHRSTWAALTNAVSPGTAVSIPVSADRSIQFEGTFGAGTCVLEGSNDDDGSGATGHYHTLHDPLGNPISATTGAIFQVSENVLWMRPNVSGADGSTSVVATLASRGTL